MLILLSPSKTLDETSKLPAKLAVTHPILLAESIQLMMVLKKHSASEIAKLMSLSDKLSELNYGRFQQWEAPFTKENTRPALYTFMGDVYEGLEAATLNAKAVERAQKHLRILSGLYGVLKPLDLMQPYRLEMGTKLTTPRGKNLYQFWGGRITEALNAEKPSFIVNLASEEYFSAVQRKALTAALITPVFKEKKGSQLKVIGLFAKRARGMMARYLLTENIITPKKMQRFDAGGYQYRPDLSTETEMVFVR